MKKYSLEFGKIEKVLNHACQTCQLSRPYKVGAVMAIIRECRPTTIDEWNKWYFENTVKITPEGLAEPGQRLYEKITGVVIPEWQTAFNQLTTKDSSERMRASFPDPEHTLGGKVFIVFSLDGEIPNGYFLRNNIRNKKAVGKI